MNYKKALASNGHPSEAFKMLELGIVLYILKENKEFMIYQVCEALKKKSRKVILCILNISRQKRFK